MISTKEWSRNSLEFFRNDAAYNSQVALALVTIAIAILLHTAWLSRNYSSTRQAQKSEGQMYIRSMTCVACVASIITGIAIYISKYM
jgi:ABC-type Fe3+ transport system permease subunit